MKNSVRLMLSVALVAGLSACGGERPDDSGEPVVIEERGTAGAEGAEQLSMVEPGSARLGGVADLALLQDPSSPLSKRVFYFDFDRSEVSSEDRAILENHARFLADHPELSVVVEGHADERGSREYNLALGERRSQAIASLLKLLGATREQLQEISFGEERPVALGHDEEAWHLNRRVELLYSGM